MFTFHTVKKIGDRAYLGDDLFIIERVRRKRALNMHHLISERNKNKNRLFDKNDKPNHT